MLRAPPGMLAMHRSHGFSLVEMIVAIVIISVGLAGVLSAFTTTVRSSADPMVRKQQMAVAEVMMEEILLKPYVDPGTAGSIPVGSCVRSSADDIQDYTAYTNRPVCDVDGTPVASLSAYSVSVTVDPTASLGGLTSDVTKITVTVSRSGTESISLIGWRTKYAL